MVCAVCGLDVTGEVRYCPRCGSSMSQEPRAATEPPPWMPLTQYPVGHPTSRRGIDGHVQTLGILWCVYAGYRGLHVLFGAAMLHTVFHHYGRWGGGWTGESGIPMGWLSPLLPIFRILSLFWVGLAALTGYSLLTRKPWGRTLALVVAVLTLIRIPLGTALGIYTLWALAPAASEMEYQTLSRG